MTILIVEDEYNDYLFAKTILTIAGHEHIWVNKGIEAVELCKSNNDINLVLMDIRLSGMDGFETTKKIKATRKDLPIIAITAYAMANDKETALNNGCIDYLSKPYRADVLLKLIEKWNKIDKINP
jgi:two-component system, cell cycle response regulator DivK